MITPREELISLTRKAQQLGMTQIELEQLKNLGDDGCGVVAQLEQLYVWLSNADGGSGRKTLLSTNCAAAACPMCGRPF